MKINSELIQQLRKKRSWSQDELAIATGLNLRTIQRIEKEASASLQSRKAIASALEVAIEVLDYVEPVMVTKYEFKTLEIKTDEGFFAGLTKAKVPDFAEILNQEGENGWELVQILTPEIAQGMWLGKTGKFVAILQRKK
ncbi:transcriptional regulator, XRE family [Pseudoalteromonas luteoviolacea B = ATCC 29581]|nr:transcriptional regulator, XRE family [Pseudoalteromonas luteoviolacea B = ATCC 29581]